MLNLAAMTPIVLEEKVQLNERGSYLISHTPSAFGTMQMTLLRNAADGTFNLEANPGIKSFQHQAFNINNKSFDGSVTGVDKKYKAHSSILDSIKFEDSKSIATIFTNGNNNDFATVSLFPIITPLDKNIVLKENSYLKLRTINKIVLHMEVNSTSNIVEGKNSNLAHEVFYTDTYVIPKEFDPKTGNASMFDIYVKNEDKEDIQGDKAFLPGELTTSATGSSKIKLNTIPFSGDEEFDNAKKVSSIDIFDYTYYDYDKKKLEVGYGKNSEKGLTVPFEFKGDFRRVFKISPNYIFKNMNVMQENNIGQPMLNPYDGKVILHIEDVSEDSHDWRLISSEDFERLEDTDPSLEGLKRISYEENI